MPAGNKTKLTPALQTAIIQAVSVGVPFYQAAEMAGVDATTVRQWRQRGEGTHPTRGRTPAYVAFVAELKRAEAQDEARRIARINQAGQGGTIISESTTTYPDGRIEREVKRTAPQWQADAWHLERKYPDRYGRRDRLALTDPSGEQSWEPLAGLAALLDHARTRLASTNGHAPPLLPVPPEEGS